MLYTLATLVKLPIKHFESRVSLSNFCNLVKFSKFSLQHKNNNWLSEKLFFSKIETERVGSQFWTLTFQVCVILRNVASNFRFIFRIFLANPWALFSSLSSGEYSPKYDWEWNKTSILLVRILQGVQKILINHQSAISCYEISMVILNMWVYTLGLGLDLDHNKVDLAEVYIKRSAIITKGEKGREMWHIFFVFWSKISMLLDLWHI